MARIGLRYALISIRNASGPVRIRDFHLNASTYSVSGEGSFACSDGNLNEIWEMCRHTHRLCMEDSFTDCPTYEQAFWLGDAQTSAAIDHFVYGEYRFVRHNLLLAASALQNTPLFNALTPTDWNTAIPMWTFNWMISVTEYIMVTGDETILTDLYETIRNALLYYHSLLTEEGGLVVHSWNLIDWAPLDTPEGSVLTAYQGMLSFCFDRYAAYARKLEKEADAALFEETAVRMRGFLNERLWREDHQAFCDAWHPRKGYSSTFSIQTHSLLLLFDGITDSRRKEISWQYLEKKPENFVDAGSPFMLYYCYEAMASRGMIPQILSDIRKRWGEMIRYESTTCWEVFPGFYENSRTRSYAHAWSAAPAAFMQKYLSGVHMEKPGWKEISFSVPDLPGTDITWCRATIPTPYGPIHASWDKTRNETHLQVPNGVGVRHQIVKYRR